MYHKNCNLCKKRGHFSKQRIKVKEIEPETSSESDVSETLFIGTITGNDLISFDDKEWTIDIVANNAVINFKIDTGAQANILPYQEYCQLEKRPKLNKTKVSSCAYNGTIIPVVRSCIVQLEYKNKLVPILFIVADMKSPPIIGLKTSTDLELIKCIHQIYKIKTVITDYLQEFSDCFGKIGCFTRTHSIVTDPEVQPTINPPRRVPIALHNRLHDELQCMIKMKVITPVEEPSDWVSNYVVVEKPDKSFRICLDPRDLIKAIKRPHFYLPTTEGIIAKISTGKIFTKLDASCAYWQIPIDYQSSKLLTFSTPFGRYRFLRMPYGISSASDVCQMYISQMLDVIEGSTNSQDDIIWGDDEHQLKQRTLEVFKVIRKSGMKLNKSKCSFHQPELIYLEHKITAEGVFPDESKIKAIKDMMYPKTIKELQRFLGSINYLGKFIPHARYNKTLERALKKKCHMVLRRTS